MALDYYHAAYPGVGSGRDGVLRGRVERAGTFYLQVTAQGGYNDQVRFITVQADELAASKVNARIPLALLMLITAGALLVLRDRRA
ncbi:hypothetical protein [Kribbella sancticallisti]|uniref:hypothetical protein n=1 Tax=Kribbella sancticallisti TaxID=460087 RepID=UPI0031E02BD3